MPTTTYLSSEEIAGLLIKGIKNVELLPTDLLQYLEKGEIPVERLLYIHSSKPADKLLSEINAAKEAKDSARAKQFLTRLYRILKYVLGDKKYESALQEIQNKKTYTELKKMHYMQSPSATKGLKWILSDECTNYDDFIDIYNKSLEHIQPEKLFQNFADESGEYTALKNKITKLFREKYDPALAKLGFTKTELEGLERQLEKLIAKLEKPDTLDQKLMQKFNREHKQSTKNTESTTDEPSETEELKKQIAALTEENRKLKRQLIKLSTETLDIQMFGKKIKQAKNSAKESLDITSSIEHE